MRLKPVTRATLAALLPAAMLFAGAPATHAAPLRVGSGILQARILVDTSSIEVFAQGGESVLTDLVFPASGRRSLRLAGDAAAPSTFRIAVHELRAAPPVA